MGESWVIGAEPEVGILFEGPLADPRRSIDVTPLLGYLAVRAFEKEVERIEALQADILEKELFHRQLKRQRLEAAARERRAREEAVAAAQAAAHATAPTEDGIAGTSEASPEAVTGAGTEGQSGAQGIGSDGVAGADSEALTDLIAAEGGTAPQADARPGGLDAGLDAGVEPAAEAESTNDGDAAAAPPDLPLLPSISVEEVPVFDIRPTLPLISRPSERLPLAPAEPQAEPVPKYKLMPNGVILKVN